MAVDVELILAHHGILGQKWGIRKAYNRGADPSTITDGQKKTRKALVGGFAVLGAAGFIRSGIHYLTAHPEVRSRSVNSIKDTKELGIGKDVFKVILEDGRYFLR